MKVLFLQHGEFDGPGLFAPVLAECGIALETRHVWRGEAVPSQPGAYAGIAFGGGGMSVYEAEQHPFLKEEILLVQATRAANRPMLGMCLGAQLMAEALGGRVFANGAKEIGFHEVRFTPEAEGDALWHGHTAAFQPVHWHGDTFSLPPDAALLASSTLTPHQLFRVGDRSYGFQFHLEIDSAVLSAMVADDTEGYLPAHGVDPAALLHSAATRLPAVEPTARTVFARWAGLLG